MKRASPWDLPPAKRPKTPAPAPPKTVIAAPKPARPITNRLMPNDKIPVVANNILTAEEQETISKYNAECKAKWARPPLERPIEVDKDDIIFQQISIDYEDTRNVGSRMEQLSGSTLEKIPVIYAFGVTEKGHSIMAQIYGFEPYLYIPVPPGMLVDEESDLATCVELRNILNQRVAATITKKKHTMSTYVTRVEIVLRQPLFRYMPADVRVPLFKVTTALPGHVPCVVNVCTTGFAMLGQPYRTYPTYESNVLFPLRYMIDRAIVGMSWIKVPAGRYVLSPPYQQLSTCQIEICLNYEELVVLPTGGEWIKTAPLRALSFDIECFSDGPFPKPDIIKNQVIQIGNVATVYDGVYNSTPFVKNLFSLNNCSPLENVGIDVRCFATEKELLLAWKDFINTVDPDIIIGHNIMNFDLTYLWDKANMLKIGHSFTQTSRIRGHQVHQRESSTSSKAYGKRESHTFSMHGRLFVDALIVISRSPMLKFTSYTLNGLSKSILGDQKDDLPHSIIGKLYMGTPMNRRRIASYCVKDALLPIKLLEKTKLTVGAVEDARITGVPFMYLIERGQSIKVVSQIYRRAGPAGYVIPKLEKKTNAADDVTDSEVGFEGATVLDPLVGFYEVPIFTLDFSSLYPSIMRAHNLCYTTLITDAIAKRYELVEGRDYTVTPTGDRFVNKTTKQGLLPAILDDLIAARNAVKKEMAVEKDAARKSVLDQRQNSIKTSANSVYGFTGATLGALPCLEISSSVTAFGREMIEMAKTHVETTYNKANGYKYDCKVIYGDTDSIMVHSGPITLEESMNLGRLAAVTVSKQFISPIAMLFEKCYKPWLLLAKKRYTGIKYESLDKGKKDAKGIETVRRDNCPLVQEVASVCLDYILAEKGVDGAVAFCVDVISKLLLNKFDMSKLIITKNLAKEDYSGQQPHVELNKKLIARGQKGYSIGDRVSFILRKGTKKESISDLAEDPIYALEHNIQPNPEKYIERLQKVLARIFEPINPKLMDTIFKGEHMRVKRIETPTSSPLFQFMVKIHTCLKCRQTLKAGESNPCAECVKTGGMQGSYVALLDEKRQHELAYNEYLEICYKCQDAGRQEVICEARDCEIFYKRIQARTLTERTDEKIKSFTAKATDGSLNW